MIRCIIVIAVKYIPESLFADLILCTEPRVDRLIILQFRGIFTKTSGNVQLLIDFMIVAARWTVSRFKTDVQAVHVL